MGKKDFILFRKVNQLLFFNKFKLSIVYFDIFIITFYGKLQKCHILYILYIQCSLNGNFDFFSHLTFNSLELKIVMTNIMFINVQYIDQY